MKVIISSAKQLNTVYFKWLLAFFVVGIKARVLWARGNLPDLSFASYLVFCKKSTELVRSIMGCPWELLEEAEGVWGGLPDHYSFPDPSRCLCFVLPFIQ